jgi:hypothetical protein
MSSLLEKEEDLIDVRFERALNRLLFVGEKSLSSRGCPSGFTRGVFIRYFQRKRGEGVDSVGEVEK